MKVYVISISTGEYDTYYENIIGVWDNKETAESIKAKIDSDIEAIRAKPCPLNQTDIDNYPDIPEDLYKSYAEWDNEQCYASDFNSVKIKEFELNKDIREEHE